MPERPSFDPRQADDAATTLGGPSPTPIGARAVRSPVEGASSAIRYLLGEEIARGGMGVVYRATDTVLGREVAVKVLQVRYTPDSAVARRFADEARITGQLQHPNIPAVHDLGALPDGWPFLAMKLIKGETLESLLRRRADRTVGRGPLVAAFEQVCQAVAYAHAHDVIHRDLKPANVMVGAFGEVQVMDWGLAKVLGRRPEDRTDPELTAAMTAVRTLRDNDDLVTQAGSVLGTPAFMPPEQAAGAVSTIDKRSDVFGLGAVLAVVLTGQPPFVADTSESTRVKAALGEVGECFARLDACGADPDLVALCKHCLAPRPQDRPTDAAAVAKAVAALRLAADERARQAELERVKAEGEARKAEALAAEQGQRRRMLMAASAVIALVLLAGLSVSLWQMSRATVAEGHANRNAQQAIEERNAKDVALKAEQQARQDETKAQKQAFAALRSMTADVIEKKFAQGAVLTDDDRAFLRGIIAQFDAFAAIKGNDADNLAVQAEGRFRVGEIRARLGEVKEAAKNYDEALRLYEQLAAHSNLRPELGLWYGSAHLNRGALLRSTGRLRAAEFDFDEAMRIFKRLSVDFPSRPDFRQYLAASYADRGLVWMDAGRLREAEKDCDHALDMYKRLAADFPTRPAFRQNLATSHTNRGNVLRATGRLKEAQNDYDAALDINHKLAVEFPKQHEFRDLLATSHSNRAVLLTELGQLKEAEKSHDQALRIRRQLAAEFPAVPNYRQDLSMSHHNRAVLLRAEGRLKDAEKDNEQALRIRQQLTADFPFRPEYRQDLAMTYISLGNLRRLMGRLNEAEKDYEQALAIYKPLAATFPNQPDLRNNVAGTCLNLAALYLEQGNCGAAKRLLTEGRPHHLAALKANPKNPIYRQCYRGHLKVLTGVHAGLFAQADAVHTAEIRRNLGWDAPADAYDAACFLSQCIPTGAQPNTLDAKHRAAAVRFYGDAAMKLLREALSKGYKDVAHMKNDTDLDPLRQREDFIELMAKLEGRGK